MKRINFILGCHSHQPVGNFDFVFEEAYEKSYLPFINVLERYPAVRMTLHYTGPLWDWFLAHRPEYIERIAALVTAGQVEIMGGGYYEPLLCAIPERDAIAQIHRMQDFCLEHFGEKPRGMWLTERVWEPGMASTLARAGVEYTALDDAHFICSGVPKEKLFGYYMTEDEGHTLKLFPILEPLRYYVPFHPVEETIAYLREHATEDGRGCAVLHDDGEKFGVWPGTYHSVYEEGWLEAFFQALTDNREWLRCRRYGDYVDEQRAVGRAYITCASYAEMMAWALPSNAQRQLHALECELKEDENKARRYGPFIRGGFWRNFLAKYEESNNIQKHMLRVSNRIERLRGEHGRTSSFQAAEKNLHQGQCNCAYWHGAFGGLYLNHLRTALYERFIAADRCLDALEGRDQEWLAVEVTDFDADGNEDVILENRHLALFLNPADGATLFELDYKDKPFNFGNTLTRRDEPYHDALREGTVQLGEEPSGGESIHDAVRAKESGLDGFLVQDPYRRVSLRDHFFRGPISADALWAGEFDEYAHFATGPWRMEPLEDGVRFTREAPIHGERNGTLHVSKRIRLRPGESACQIRYDIGHKGEAAFEGLFGTELAVNLLTGSAHDRYYRSDDRYLKGVLLGERGCDEHLSHYALRDDWQQVECGFRFSRPAVVYRFPIETVSQSEGGQERVYQGSVVTPCWPVRCAPGETVRLTIDLEIVDTADL